ncbi:MAG: serine protease [Coleofasciculaceae cyanobacterium]
MNYFYGLSATIIGVAIVVMIPNPIATAELNQQAIANIAQEVTVIIDGQNPGSGVIIDKEGNSYSVLTAQHVVPRQDEYEVVTSDQKRYLLDYSKVKLLPDVDLAILEFNSRENYPVAKLGDSDQVSLGKTVYVAGWPHPEAPITESIFTFAGGNIAARPPRPLPAGYQLIYTNITRSGSF